VRLASYGHHTKCIFMYIAVLNDISVAVAVMLYLFGAYLLFFPVIYL